MRMKIVLLILINQYISCSFSNQRFLLFFQVILKLIIYAFPLTSILLLFSLFIVLNLHYCLFYSILLLNFHIFINLSNFTNFHTSNYKTLDFAFYASFREEFSYNFNYLISSYVISYSVINFGLVAYFLKIIYIDTLVGCPCQHYQFPSLEFHSQLSVQNFSYETASKTLFNK